jgi:hypothetical protein
MATLSKHLVLVVDDERVFGTPLQGYSRQRDTMLPPRRMASKLFCT